jgi:hypothetical protein
MLLVCVCVCVCVCNFTITHMATMSNLEFAGKKFVFTELVRNLWVL